MILAAGDLGLIGSLNLTGQVRDIWAALLMAPAAVLLFEFASMELRRYPQGLFQGLGNLTYSSYMIHFPLQLATVTVLDWLGIPIATILHERWLFLAYLGVVLILAHFTYHGFERPAQDALRRIGRQWMPSKPATAPVRPQTLR